MTQKERREHLIMAAKAYASAMKPETREERLQRAKREIREMMEQCKRGYWPDWVCR